MSKGQDGTVRCVGLSHVYRTADAEVPALTDIDLEVPSGGRLAVIGTSGAGKSTLLTLLAGLQRPTHGQLWVGGDDLATLPERRLIGLRGTRIATVVQNPSRNLLAYGTAEDNIRFAQSPIPRNDRRLLPEPADLLDRLGLGEFAGRRVAQMSGGEQQRLSIAVGLARSPAVLLLDEPTSQLDTASRDRVVELIARLTQEAGCTVLAVTHDPAVATALGRSVTLAAGRIVGHDLHLDRDDDGFGHHVDEVTQLPDGLPGHVDTPAVEHPAAHPAGQPTAAARHDDQWPEGMGWTDGGDARG